MLTEVRSRDVRCKAQDQPGMVIRRCYQPDPAALEDLVELLHRLLVEYAGTELPDPMPALAPHQTCFSAHVE